MQVCPSALSFDTCTCQGILTVLQCLRKLSSVNEAMLKLQARCIVTNQLRWTAEGTSLEGSLDNSIKGYG